MVRSTSRIERRRIAGFRRCRLRRRRRERAACPVRFALSDAAGVTASEAEVGHFDLRDRNADKVLPLLPDQLSLRDIFLQVLLDLPPDDLTKAKESCSMFKTIEFQSEISKSQIGPCISHSPISIFGFRI